MADAGFPIVQGPGWMLFIYLVVAQCVSAFSYPVLRRASTRLALTHFFFRANANQSRESITSWNLPLAASSGGA